MKKFLLKILAFFNGGSKAKYFLQIVFYLALLAVFTVLAINDVVSNVFGTIIGFLFSTMLIYILRVISLGMEDLLKVNYDTETLLKTYYKHSDYKKTLRYGDTEADFAYAETLINDGYDFEVYDDPEKMMELDDFIANNYERLFSAHSGSAKVNGVTIRLDKAEIEGKTCRLYLSRSTFFNHLVTNRAIDFKMFEEISLRDLFEYGPKLNTYENSKMSNHVGINGLVFLSDGNLLVPHRRGDSTISKNKVTSSIAVKLNFPKTGEKTVTAEHLLYGNIIDNLSARTRIPAKYLDRSCIDVHFLGFGQSVYEGGKPQFYYVVRLNGIDTKTYCRISAIDDDYSSIDVDKCIYVADYSTYRFDGKKHLSFEYVTEKGKRKRTLLGYEMSYLANLWHYEQWKAKQAQNV